MHKLIANLRKDKKDETRAIKNYGKRKAQAINTGLAPMLSHIQNEEKGHKKHLASAIKKIRIR